MLLTPNQIEQLFETIDYSLTFFVMENVGWEVLSPSELNLLNKFGINIEDYKYKETYLNYAFKFGMLSEILGGEKVKNMTFDEIKRHISSTSFLPLTSYEKEVLNSVKRQTLKDIRGLGNKIKAGTDEILIDVDKEKRAQTEDIIREEAEEAIRNRESVRQLAGRLMKKTGDYARDWGRISDFVMHSAFDEGRAVMIERESGREALVYKDVYPGACPECIKLYLTGGIGSPPKIFKLQELINNKNNIGRKTNEWKPVIGGTHPWCRCTLNKLLQDKEFDPTTGGYTKDKPYERKVQRKSKIGIRVGEKVSEI